MKIDNKRRIKERFISLVYHNIFPIVVIAFPIVFFFARLFYPEQSLFIIADFGESDVLHLNLPFKELLSVSLKKGEWPLWTDKIGMGFPLLAEGQIGTFYLPNLIFFRFLPTVPSYNLNLLLSFILSSLGMYLLSGSLGFSKIARLFTSTVFTFSGFLSVHLNHFNLIQAACLFPFVSWSFLLLLKYPSIKYSALFSFFLSQQIFTGHFYIVFISLIGLIFLILLKPYEIVKKKQIFFILLSVVITLSFSAIQVLPTVELMKLSGRRSGLDFETVTAYPYPYKHLLTLINPYAFGDPSKGTYPAFSSDWGIFWENTAYIGLFPLILALLSLFFIREKIVKTSLLLLIVSLFLVLGKYSPLYLVFSVPPFNFFRVPSKFLLLTTFSLTILSGFMLNQILTKIKVWFSRKSLVLSLSVRISFFLVVFTLILADLFRFSYNYPPVSPSKKWLEETETSIFLKAKDKDERVLSVGAPLLWNSVFLKKGWQDITPYLYFRNSLYPNYNALFSISTPDINTGGLLPRRLAAFNQFMKTISFNETLNSASISAISSQAISLAGVKYLISSFEIDDPGFSKTKQISPKGLDLPSINIYENKNARKRFYLAYNTKKIITLEDFYRELDEDSLDRSTVFIENNNLDVGNDYEANGIVRNIYDKETEILLEVDTNKDSYLIVSDTKYPGWSALVDEIPSEAISVNLNQRAVLVPKGVHQVRLAFRSNSFEIGKRISFFSFFTVFLALFLYRGFFPHKASGKKSLSRYL